MPAPGKRAPAATAPRSGTAESRRRALENARDTLDRLRAAHPDAHCELDHRGPFQLLVATVLSAQTTDVNVNKATPGLFAKWPTPGALAAADPAEVERAIGSLGFFRQKTKSIVGLSKLLVEKHGGEVPRTLEELVKLPGVGRKTANVVLGVVWNTPEGVVVDTHVQRISQRLGWTRNTEPEKIEQDLVKLFPREDWDPVGHTLIFHGRRICSAARPACAACAVHDACPSAFKAEQVGRKALPLRGRPRVVRDRPSAKAGKKTKLAKSATKPAKAVRKAARKAPKPGRGKS